MPSKQVADRQKSVTAVLAAIQVHGPLVDAGLHDLLGAEAPSIQPLLQACAGALTRHADLLAQADAQHDAELADDDGLRDARDRATDATYEGVLKLRKTVDALFGAATLTALGLSGTTPRDPALLVTFTRQAAGQLRLVTVPAPQIEGAVFDTAAQADKLESLAALLDGAWQAVAREVREGEATQVHKDQAMARHDAVFTRTAGLVEAVFRLAGQDSLADKVRPSRRQPGRTAALVDPAVTEPEPLPTAV
jgi:hypothetical protein